jgi:CRP-like cAMP-binding protein
MNHNPTLAPMLRKLRLWAQLDASHEQALLDLPHNVVALARNKTFVRDGEAVSHCWLVLSGFCVRLKYVGNGGRQIVSIHMKGDLVDLQNSLLGVADHSVQTLTPCNMAKLPIKAVKELTDTHPAIKNAFGTIRWSMVRYIANGRLT